MIVKSQVVAKERNFCFLSDEHYSREARYEFFFFSVPSYIEDRF